MAKKVLVGGVVGGIVLFVWGAVSHMVLPLGEVGIKEMPNEQLRSNAKRWLCARAAPCVDPNRLP